MERKKRIDKRSLRLANLKNVDEMALTNKEKAQKKFYKQISKNEAYQKAKHDLISQFVASEGDVEIMDKVN